jgi:hypothetical protein
MSKTNVNPALMMELNPFSPISETYHSLRANIEFTCSKQDIGILTVTSSQRGEGKTTTAVNLALAYSRSGKRVLLIDADLRYPALHDILDLPRRQGFSDYLQDRTPIAEVVKDTGYANLSAITSGSLPANPIPGVQKRIRPNYCRRPSAADGGGLPNHRFFDGRGRARGGIRENPAGAAAEGGQVAGACWDADSRDRDQQGPAQNVTSYHSNLR